MFAIGNEVTRQGSALVGRIVGFDGDTHAFVRKQGSSSVVRVLLSDLVKKGA